MDNNNIDINKMMEMLSKMDKKELEEGFVKATEILKNNNKEDILKNFGKFEK